MAAEQEPVAGTPYWTKYGSGYLDNLSAEQRRILEQFNARVPDEDMNDVKFMHDTRDSCATRFLRARKYDLEAALAMFNATVAWRRTAKPFALVGKTDRQLLGCSVDELQAFYPHRMLSTFDKKGRPIYIERTGAIDIEGCLLITSQEKLLRYHLAVQEGRQIQQMKAGTEAVGAAFPVDNGVSILDLNGMSRSQITRQVISYIKAVSAIDQAYYPELLGKMYIINAPTVFSIAWKLINGFLDERTVAKIVITSGTGTDLLLADIDKASLPVEYGGSLAIPGGLFPKSSTLEVAVARNSKLEHPYDVTDTEPIVIKFFVRGGALNFSVVFEPVGGDKKKRVELVPSSTRDIGAMYKIPVTPPAAGRVICIFDNSGTWFQRTVFVRKDLASEVAQEEDKSADEAVFSSVGGDVGDLALDTPAGTPATGTPAAGTPAADTPAAGGAAAGSA